MPLRSTRQYLIELEQLTAESAGHARRDLLRRVTDLFLLTVERQTFDDRAVFGQVMERLAYRFDAAARGELAERLADAPAAPEALLGRLARDDIEVARPLLERSQNLSDAALVAVAREAGSDHARTIAGRAPLSGHVTDALVARGEEPLLLRLIANPSAAISRSGMESLATRARINARVRDALAARTDLPADIRARLPARTERHPADTGADRASADEVALARAARAGRSGEATDLLAALSGLARQEAEQCLLQAGILSLIVLCRAHGLAATTFSALLQLRIDAGALTPMGVAGAMRRYEAMEPETARRIQYFLRSRRSGPRPPQQA